MKRIILLTVITNWLFINALTAQNPFKEFGVDVPVITLSKGKYPEFIPNDTIHRIGTVVIDTRTGKIIELINTDSIELTYNYRPDVASRWISPDPLAEEYWDWSPYNYCMNDPIKFIDPDGRYIRIYYGDNDDDWYQYKNGNLYNANGDKVDIKSIENQFVLQTFETLNGLVSADNLGIINTLANDESENNILQMTWDEHAASTGANVYFSPEGGIILDNNERQSPALALIHELGHNYVFYYSALDKQEPQLKDFVIEKNLLQ